MAYARWSNESSLYVYMSKDGLVCAACLLMPFVEGAKIRVNQSFIAHNTMEMIDHIGQHMDDGEQVPDDLIPALLADDEENFPEEE
jgi:hypothetical protein